LKEEKKKTDLEKKCCLGFELKTGFLWMLKSVVFFFSAEDDISSDT
jgi:hypothetical protein